MSEFVDEVVARVARTTESLAAARAADDDYLAAVLYGELESLARVAEENDVEVPGLADALARHGGTPDEVRLPDEAQVIDLGTSDAETGGQRIA